MGVQRPDLVVGVPAWERMDRRMQDALNLDGAAFALDAIGDRDGFRIENGRDEWCKKSHWAANRTTEDGLKGLTLLLVGLLIEVQRDRPVSFAHDAWCTSKLGHIQAIKRDITVAATRDVEAPGPLTGSLC